MRWSSSCCHTSSALRCAPSACSSAPRTARRCGVARRPAPRSRRTLSTFLSTDRAGDITLTLAGSQLPALFDASESPHGDGEKPGDHEQPHDDEPGGVEVDAADDTPHTTRELEVLDTDRDHLDGSDEERDGDRQARDGEVVEHLAHRLRERPAI